MAPNIPSAKLTLSCPLFAADFDPRNHAFLLVAGGGGEGRSGVGNKIALLNASKRHELSEVVDIELSRDEDSVTSLAAAHSTDSSIVALAGINSSVAEQKKNNNQHLRSFQIDYPPRRTDSKESKPSTEKEKGPGRTTALSRASLFRTKGGSNQQTDTYQRITHLSPWKGEGAPRVAAIATGLAPSGEIVFFNANSTRPGQDDVIGRIRLNSDEEAEDVDITQQDEDDGLFTVAYTNGTDVFTCRISPKTRSNAAPEVKCVYSPTTKPTAKGPRPKFRALRFLSPTTLLLLQNVPDRKGCELILLDLRSSSPGAIIRTHKLRSSIKIGLGLDVCNLGTNPSNQQQSIIAISGSDQSLEILTIDFDASRQHRQTAGYTHFRRYTTLRDVHPFSMTRICFSTFIPPAHPVSPNTPPQYVKLASVSMGNTVVVHTFPLSPTPPSSRTPRYVLVVPGASELWTNLSSTLTAILSILLVIFLIQAFTEIRGVMPPYLGITEYLPPDIRNAIARPYNAPPPPPSPFPPNTEVNPQPQLLRNLIPSSIDTEPNTPLVISCDPSTNEILVEPNSPIAVSQSNKDADGEGEQNEEGEDVSQSEVGVHAPQRWIDLSEGARLSWKHQLISAGYLTPEDDEGILRDGNVLFRELCPQP